MSQKSNTKPKVVSNKQPLNTGVRRAAVSRKRAGFFGRMSVPVKLILISAILAPNYIMSLAGSVRTHSAYSEVFKNQIKGAEAIESLIIVEDKIYQSMASGNLANSTIQSELKKLEETFRSQKQLALADMAARAYQAMTNIPQKSKSVNLVKILSEYHAKSIKPMYVAISHAYSMGQADQSVLSALNQAVVNQIPLDVAQFNKITQLVLDSKTKAKTDNLVSAQKRLTGEFFEDLERVASTEPNSYLVANEPVSFENAQALRDGLDSYRVSLDNYYASTANGNLYGIIESYSDVMLALNKVKQSFLSEIKYVSDKRSRYFSLNARLSYYFGPLTLLFTALISYLAIRSIVRPLRDLERGARKVENGQFHVRVPVTSDDEIGQVVRAFNSAASKLQDSAQKREIERIESSQMQNNINEFLDVAMDIAEGDLTKRGKVTEDVLGNVVDSINLMTEELGGVLRQVQDASESVVNNSKEVLLDSNKITDGVQTTAQETSSVSVQIQGLIEGIRQMAEDAQASAKTARLALEASKQGQDAVEETLTGMQDIRQEVQSMSKRIQILGDRSQEIEEIVDTISQITRQTNLLALNASVEAAGAGKAGGRFTIVAAEVRKLANTSAQATTRIANLIKTVQVEIQDVIEGISQSSQQVEDGYKVAGSTGERINEISSLVEDSAKFADKIADSTSMQAATAERVGIVVKQIADIAQESKESAQRSQNTAANLEKLARKLGESLDKFKLPQ